MGPLGLPGRKVVPAKVVLAPPVFISTRARLTRGEILGLIVIVLACVLAVAYEFGYRRAAMLDASLANLAATKPTLKAPAVQPAPTTAAPRTKAMDEIVEFEIKDRSTHNDGVSDPRDDPFRTPGTIYRCRRYDGSVFWSDLHCGRHRGALIERIAKVPADLPFDQQVRLAREQARKFESSLQAEQAELQRMNTCASMVGERAQILRRETDVTVLADVHSSDRRRGREIDSMLQRLRCGG
jgi:hypothetical protein